MKRLAAILFLVFLPLQAQARSERTDSIAKGVTAAVYVHPSSSTKAKPDNAIKKAFEEARQLYKDLDAKSGGEVGQINKNAGKGKVKVSDPFLTLLKVCMQISEWTQGLFDVVRGQPGKKSTDLMVDFGSNEVSLPDKKAWVDFSGVRNGYVVDRMAGRLHAEGYDNFMIQSGGIVRTMGKDGSDYWKLNIPDPNGKRNLCRVSLEASSVVTADVRTTPVKTDLKSVTVITRNATNANALASTALLVGKSRAEGMFRSIAQPGFGAILEDKAGKILTIGDVTAACFEE